MAPSHPRRKPTQDDNDDDDEDTADYGEGDENASSSQVRKAQNRIAQREFRLRKQQYIRDLEARVEVLSGDKEERVELMVLLIRNLLKENKDLRNMVKSMASFVGEGLGSCLPRLGLSASQLDAILNRADTDTAYDAFLALKASKEVEEANPGIVLGEVKHRRSHVEKGKRKRGSIDGDPGSASVDLSADNASQGRASIPNDHEPQMSQNGQTVPNGHVACDTGFEHKPSLDPDNALEQYSYLFPDLEALASNAQMSTQPSNPLSIPYSAVAPSGYYGNALGPFPPQSTPYGMGVTSYPFNVNSPSWFNLFQTPLTTPFASNDPSQQLGFPEAVSNNTRVNGSFPPAASSQVDSGGPNTPISGQGGASGMSNGSSSSNAGHVQVVAEKKTPTSDELETQRLLRTAIEKAADGKGHPSRMTVQEIEERQRLLKELSDSLMAAGVSDRILEALQLVSYHLTNFRLNQSYILPPSLRPTNIQKTVLHEYMIDGVMLPTMRDRMILLRGQYDFVEVFSGMLKEFTIHGEDMLNHNNWEISDKWLSSFSFLADDYVYEITNKWRKTRGEPKLVRPIADPVMVAHRRSIP